MRQLGGPANPTPFALRLSKGRRLARGRAGSPRTVEGCGKGAGPPSRLRAPWACRRAGAMRAVGQAHRERWERRFRAGRMEQVSGAQDSGHPRVGALGNNNRGPVAGMRPSPRWPVPYFLCAAKSFAPSMHCWYMAGSPIQAAAIGLPLIFLSISSKAGKSPAWQANRA